MSLLGFEARSFFVGACLGAAVAVLVCSLFMGRKP